MGSLSVFDESIQIQYPIARRDDSVIDNYHGVNVPDPYRWLENPDAEQVKEFVQKQAVLTDSVLKTCDCRAKLVDTIKKVFDHPRYTAPFKRGANHYFYFHNTGLQPQTVLYVQVTYFLNLIYFFFFCFTLLCNLSKLFQDSLEGEAEVLLDPNVLSEDGTVSLNTFSISQDAKFLAYGLSSSGSDWVTIKLMRVHDKVVEPDTLSWVSDISYLFR